MSTIAKLTSCPVCGEALTPDAAACPGCKTNLADFFVLIEDARMELDAARVALAKGDRSAVDHAVLRANEIFGGFEAEGASLRIRAAILDEDFDAARELLSGLPEGTEKTTVSEKLSRREDSVGAARERFNLALTSARKGMLVEAVDQLKAAIALAPDMLPAYRLLAKVYMDIGNREAAKAIAAEGLRRFPGDAGLDQMAELASGLAGAGVQGGETRGPGRAGVFPMLLIQTVIQAVILVIALIIAFFLMSK